MASDEVRVYAVIFANFTAGSAAVSEANWRLLTNAARLQPLSAAILAAAQGRGAEKFIAANKRSQNAAHLRLYTLVGFELDRTDVDALLVILDAQAAVHGVPGNNRAKFAGVFQAELRAAALSLGYTQANANKLSVVLINGDVPNTFSRDVAIAQAQAYLAANTAIWHAPEV